MNCKTCRNLMNLYMDYSLTAEQEQEMLLHLDGCEQCRADFEAYRSMRAVFAAPPEIHLPDGFEDRIYQKIDAYEKSKVRKPFYLRKYAMGSIAACMVAGLFISSYFYSGIRPGFDQQQIDNPPIAVASATPSAQPSPGNEIAVVPDVEPSIAPEIKQPESTPKPKVVSTPRPTAKPVVQTTPTTYTEEEKTPEVTVPTPTPSPVENSSSTVRPFAKSALASTRIQISKDAGLKELLTKNGISYTEANNKIIVENTSYNKITQILKENNIDYIALDDIGSNANLIVFITE